MPCFQDFSGNSTLTSRGRCSRCPTAGDGQIPVLCQIVLQPREGIFWSKILHPVPLKSHLKLLKPQVAGLVSSPLTHCAASGGLKPAFVTRLQVIPRQVANRLRCLEQRAQASLKSREVLRKWGLEARVWGGAWDCISIRLPVMPAVLVHGLTALCTAKINVWPRLFTNLPQNQQRWENKR